ncbi:hypothetical protein, partial [Streptomyces luteolifulvus]|uniref:hypothetical protein n=1 Tax=Streptomyces luteolifulvus TaxID=2615112 RepID=UPI001CD99B84
AYHVMNVLPVMTVPTLDARQLFQPPVTQRHFEGEVAHCVGGVVSPVLANLYLHYAFDVWLTREFLTSPSSGTATMQ